MKLIDLTFHLNNNLYADYDLVNVANVVTCAVTQSSSFKFHATTPVFYSLNVQFHSYSIILFLMPLSNECEISGLPLPSI